MALVSWTYLHHQTGTCQECLSVPLSIYLQYRFHPIIGGIIGLLSHFSLVVFCCANGVPVTGRGGNLARWEIDKEGDG